MVERAKYASFQEVCETSSENDYARKFLKAGKIPLNLALERARALGVPEERIRAAETRGMIDGSITMTYEGAERVYEGVRATLNREEGKILDSFDLVRDADLIANYLFTINPEVRSKVASAENMYKVVLRVGSGRRKSSAIAEKEDQKVRPYQGTTGTQQDVISSQLKDLISQIPREEFKDNQEYQRRLRVLLRKKAEREAFPLFKKNEKEAFELLERRSKETDNENVRDVYGEVRSIYQEYKRMKTVGVNPDFRDPNTGERGVLPSLHQKIALYHILGEKRFGVFDGCGTGKTAIAILAQPLIEEQIRDDLEVRVKKGQPDFARTVVVCPNPAKKAWKKGLIGKRQERYLSSLDNGDVIVINGGVKDKDFIERLRDKRWIVLNYEQLSTKVNGTGRLLVDALKELGVDYVISDESHQIKGLSTKTKMGRPTHSAAFRDLASSAKYLTLLTGSPIPDNMRDYGVLFHLLHPDKLADPQEFVRLYQENPRILYTLFNEKTIRRTAEDINDTLSFADPVNEVVDLTPEQRKIYEHILEWQPKSWLTQARKAILDPRLVDPEILQRVGLLGKVGYQHSSKYKRLEEIITSDNGPVARGDRFVVFSSMFQEGVTRPGNESLRRKYLEAGLREEFGPRDDLERKVLTAVIEGANSLGKLSQKIGGNEDLEVELGYALGELEQREYITVDGDQVTVKLGKNGAVKRNLDYFDGLGFSFSLPQRLEKALEKRFGKKCRLGVIDGKEIDIEQRERIVDDLEDDLEGIVCTTDTGGESLDFTRANHAYFLDRDYKPKTEEQAIARQLRKGQAKQVHVTRLLADELDEALEDYVEKKRIIIRTAVDGYHLTDDEINFLEDIEGKQFSEMLKRGLGGKSINTLEAKVDTLDSFTVKRRGRGVTRVSTNHKPDESTNTDAQRLMQLIGRDPVNCWQDPEVAYLYMKALPTLSVPVTHLAKIADLASRAKRKEIVFPSTVLSEGSGPSLLYDSYQRMRELLEREGLEIPEITDRDISKIMLKLGKNSNQVLGNMTGKGSKFKNGQFEMVDNASISLLQNSAEVKKTLLEASRVLKKGNGLLELTVDGRAFHDGSGQSEEEVGGKKVRRDFYLGLEQLGFEVLSGKNEGFSLSRQYLDKLKKTHGSHYAQSFENKLAHTRFVLAQKIDNPQEDVDQANFWFMRPTAIEAEDKDSPIVLTSSMPKFMGRKKRRGRRPKSVEQHTVDTKEGRQITVGKDGVVTSVKKTGDEDE
ncbi:hypothetical protein J4416_03720 [Candidatus Pacearchaeota archaeon]|nr:hypothetical protein [Candidatus Pacearchaeota archaeon]